MDSTSRRNKYESSRCIGKNIEDYKPFRILRTVADRKKCKSTAKFSTAGTDLVACGRPSNQRVPGLLLLFLRIRLGRSTGIWRCALRLAIGRWFQRTRRRVVV